VPSALLQFIDSGGNPVQFTLDEIERAQTLLALRPFQPLQKFSDNLRDEQLKLTVRLLCSFDLCDEMLRNDFVAIFCDALLVRRGLVSIARRRLLQQRRRPLQPRRSPQAFSPLIPNSQLRRI
jgi:hypothetical protein